VSTTAACSLGLRSELRPPTPERESAPPGGVARAESGRTAIAAPIPVDSPSSAFADYFRCVDLLAPIERRGDLSTDEGYFRLGDAVCYGRCSGASARYVDEPVADVAATVSCDGGRVTLPFDLSEVVTNLRQELYRPSPLTLLQRLTSGRTPRSLYYTLRPMLPVQVRKHLQKMRLNGWQRIAFPRWPIDVSVETLMRRVMALQLKSSGMRRLPFVWFWPEGARSCAIMTHDVEGPSGRAFCEPLMDLDDRFGIRSAFQLVPDAGAEITNALAAALRGRGFEVNLHDLTHDGYLFQDQAEFGSRAAQINQYARQLQCRGFRSGSMYREQQWYAAFEFSYDMSVPNAAHLEPQRGGCCTVMPYFVGKILELPLTTTQDYSLFHILEQYSTTLWKQQIEMLLAQNGLMSFITHPDYLREKRALTVYADLLAHLRQLRAERRVWIALPGEVDGWWRSRSQMTVVPSGGSWRVEGPDSRRAKVAYAVLHGDSVTYEIDDAS
jgi:hypothetical protein